MKLTRCSAGHFYDAEKFSTCPHCDNGGESNTVPFDDTYVRTDSSESNVTQAFTTTGNEPTAPVNEKAPASTDNTAASDNDPKTEAYWATGKIQGAADDRQHSTVSPIVGWLVCVEGPNFGEAFNLYYGKNFIGRDGNMDICLKDDRSVSRDKHAVIVYEPRQRQFYAQPGESHSLFYCNNDVVLSSKQLNDRDVITIGSTNLIFVPFCDASFGWDSIKGSSEE